RAGRHEQLPAVPTQAGHDLAPPLSGSDGADWLGRAIETPAAEPARGQRRLEATSTLPREVAAGPSPGPNEQRRAPLPRRERLANLAPGLRVDASGDAGRAAPLRPPRRGPEEARGSMSAFQRGTRLGRDLAGEDKG